MGRESTSPRRANLRPVRLHTVGHSTRSLDELVAILHAHDIRLLVDVRRFPASRRHPHFARESLERALPEAGIGYLWLEDLGGRRSRAKTSPHTAWRVAGFAAYADHLERPAAEAALATLVERGDERPTAVMCAEAFPHRCHRRLIADRLVAAGHEVVHLLDEERTERHQLPDFARVEDGRVIYDGGQRPLPVE